MTAQASALLVAGFLLLSALPAAAGHVQCPDEVVVHDDASSSGAPFGLTFEAFSVLCHDRPHAVICAGHRGGLLSLKQVLAIDGGLRAEFVYRSDEATHHSGDQWDNHTLCGDCEDYALDLSERLAGHGEGGQYMRLQLMAVPVNVQMTQWGGHATLWVDTSDVGTVEISVGDIGPMPLDLSYGRRMMVIQMDGQRRPQPLPGYWVDDRTFLVFPQLRTTP